MLLGLHPPTAQTEPVYSYLGWRKLIEQDTVSSLGVAAPRWSKWLSLPLASDSLGDLLHRVVRVNSLMEEKI